MDPQTLPSTPETPELDASVPLPQRLAMVGESPAPVEGTPPAETYTPEQLVNGCLSESKDVLLSDGRGSALPRVTGRYLTLTLLRAGIRQDRLKQDLPYNAKAVPAAGWAVVKAVRTVEEARPMRVDDKELEQDLRRFAYVAEVGRPIELAYDAVQAEKAYLLNRISEAVNGGLRRVESLLDNPLLLRALTDALSVKGDPAAEAQRTRLSNARVADKARKDEQAKAPKTPPLDPAAPPTPRPPAGK